jgi:hypothetical protein
VQQRIAKYTAGGDGHQPENLKSFSYCRGILPSTEAPSSYLEAINSCLQTTFHNATVTENLAVD